MNSIIWDSVIDDNRKNRIIDEIWEEVKDVQEDKDGNLSNKYELK